MRTRVDTIDFHGLRALRLKAADGSSAVLTEHGAHVVSWQTADGHERLYLSPRSRYAQGQAIRGGIPVIFPQFGATGPLPRHGIVRTVPWHASGTGGDGTNAWAALRLESDDASRGVWPHDFAATLVLSIGPSSIDVALRIENTGSDSMAFSVALHTYLAVNRIEAALVLGLGGCSYRDHVACGAVEVQLPHELRVDGPIDRVYTDVPAILSLVEGHATTTLTSAGFPDAVVWNPGPLACSNSPDMPVDAWQRMLCIEAAAVDKPVVISPGQNWTGSQRITAPAR